jgi:hypothetical protein
VVVVVVVATAVVATAVVVVVATAVVVVVAVVEEEEEMLIPPPRSGDRQVAQLPRSLRRSHARGENARSASVVDGVVRLLLERSRALAQATRATTTA